MTTHRPPTRFPLAPQAIALIAIALLAAGCASRRPAPIDDRTTPPPATALPGTPVPATSAPIVAAPRPASETPAPPTYVVKRGDTLRQIANEHGIDWRELAAWNGIENINLIRVGQSLRLTAPGSEANAAAPGGAASGTTVTPLRTVPSLAAVDGRPPAAPAIATPRPGDATLRTGPKAIKEPWSEQALREVARTGTGIDAAVMAKADPAARQAAPPVAPPSTPANAPPPATSAAAPSASTPAAASVAPAPSPGDDDGLDWVWPAKGKLVAQFSENASLKGIDIAGTNGDAVLASAPGRVVYAGTGLRGYGKLVIIKHNATYLTAYAHNRDILVKEGQAVTRGQKIAEMGSTDADRVKLHFEIRRLGKPMDPLRFLPPA